MTYWKSFLLSLAAFVLGCSQFTAQAAPADGLSLAHTRLIMENGETSAATIFNNASQTLFLTRAVVTTFDGRPASEDFVVTPPVAFCPPGKQTRFQVALIHPERYPKDRESLFYFETQAAPGSYDDKTNTLEISYGFRIKLFYRPQGVTDNIADASENLEWTLKKGILTVRNPSKLHVTIVTVGVGSAYQKLQDGVLAPGASRAFKLKREQPEDVLIRWATIDDYGSVLQQRRVIRNAH